GACVRGPRGGRRLRCAAAAAHGLPREAESDPPRDDPAPLRRRVAALVDRAGARHDRQRRHAGALSHPPEPDAVRGPLLRRGRLMSTPCEEIRPELEALLAALSDGSLDAAAKKRLSQILRDHPDARQFYLDYCQMHALLQSAHGVLQALEAPAAVRRRRRIGIAAAAAVLLVAGAVVLLRETSRVEATVALMQGTAWIVRNGDRVALPPSGEMRPGDRVATAADSRTE